MSNNHIDLNTYLHKGANIIFNISVIIICIGYILDILAFQTISKRLIVLNVITLVLAMTVVALFYFKKLSLKISYGIIIYAIIANIIIDTFTDPYLPDRLHFLMRDSLFILIALTLASLVINKIHSIIIASIYLLVILSFALLAKNAFLLTSIYLIFVIISAYSAVVFYFVTVIEKSISTVEEDSRTIKEQSKVVNESYALLLGHQQMIEKQSEELIQQSKILQEQSELLQAQNDELNTLIATKDKFFSILAHDLKNPFNIILGFTELLDIKFDKLDDKKKRSYIVNIKNTAAKTYDLLENLLLWARAQSGRLEYNPQNISVSQLVDAVSLFFHQTCFEKQLKIIDNIDENCIVNADIDLVEIILRNLLSNAVKYTPSGGTISLDYHLNGPQVEISISDSGIGIEESDINSLFRIDKGHKNTAAKGESGTGLSLIICNELIKKHGGTIKVKSKPGKGSTFSFTLPKAV